MTLYSGQITQLLQGVSQQHPKDRGEGQIGEQINCVSDIVRGLRRRPAVKMLSELSTIATGFTLDDNTAIYSYSRGDGTEEYIMLFDTSGRIKVYDALTGAEKTVTNNVATYLTTTTPKSSLRFHTIGDTTFILNTETEMSMDATSESDAQIGESVIYCTRASYGHRYKIKINGTTYADVTTPSTVTISATTANKVTTLSTIDIMNALVSGTNPGGWTITKNLVANLTSGYSWDQQGDLLHLYKDNGTDFTLEVQDGNNNQDLKFIKTAVDTFENLPKAAPHDYKCEVKGLGDERVDNYWVKWQVDATVTTRWNATGYWQECVAPETEVDLDDTTMPVTIVRQAAGTFLADKPVWVGRAAGDTETNPDPSFIGTTATDIGSYQNRLYLLTGENIVMTQAFDQLNWFAASVAAPSDDDPVDSASSDNQITDLLHSAVYNGALILFSNNAQFIHPKDTPVTPATFAVAADTKFNVSPNIKPVTTGVNIVFPTEFGEFTNVWEYNINTLTGSPECESSTKHIPRYIEGNPEQMVANTTTDYVFLRTDSLPSCIYVNQFYVKEQKRAQLAWHKWDIENCEKVYSMTLLGQRLYIVTARGSSTYLEYLDLSLPTSDNTTKEIFLDHYYTEQVTTGSYTIGGEDYTARITLPESSITLFVQGTGGTNEGFLVTDYTIDSGYVYMNQPANAYILSGYSFTSEGILTNPYVRDAQGRPWTKRTIIEDVTINVQDTGYLTLEVGHAAGDDYTHDFNGIILNNWQYKIGEASELDTDIYLPVRDYRELVEIRFESNHHLGFSLMSMEWLVRMTTRGRRSQ